MVVVHQNIGCDDTATPHNCRYSRWARRQTFVLPINFIGKLTNTGCGACMEIDSFFVFSHHLENHTKKCTWIYAQVFTQEFIYVEIFKFGNKSLHCEFFFFASTFSAREREKDEAAVVCRLGIEVHVCGGCSSRNNVNYGADWMHNKEMQTMSYLSLWLTKCCRVSGFSFSTISTIFQFAVHIAILHMPLKVMRQESGVDMEVSSCVTYIPSVHRPKLENTLHNYNCDVHSA